MKKILVALCTIGILIFCATCASADIELMFQRSDYYFYNLYCVGLDVGDVDNDSNLDIAAVSNFDGDFAYYNNGIDHFSRAYLGIGSNHRSDVVLVDFEYDGGLDFSVGDKKWMNNGTGLFTVSQIDLWADNCYRIWDRDFADLNNDGYLDIVIAEVDFGSYVLLNDKNLKRHFTVGSFKLRINRKCAMLGFVLLF